MASERLVVEANRFSAQELSRACQQILNAELQNGAVADRDYTLNLQRGKRPNHPEMDTAPDPLVASIGPRLRNSTGYQLFFALLDNYHMETGVAEKVTTQEQQEISKFLDHVISSPPMKVAHQLLAQRGMVANDIGQFKEQLHQMWFRLYTRDTRDDTCGFEHVFVGEIKDGEVSGLHNWIQFANLEKSGALDYRGYIFPKRDNRGEVSPVTPNDLIISVQFNIKGVVKDVSSMWVGTSPEFEMALYTLCFVAGSDRNIVWLTTSTGEYEVDVRCYHIRSKYGDKVGSAFPVLLGKRASDAAQSGFQQPSHQPQPGGFAPPQQYSAPPQQYSAPPHKPQAFNAQQAPQSQANQGCGQIFVDILKGLFSAFSSRK